MPPELFLPPEACPLSDLLVLGAFLQQTSGGEVHQEFGHRCQRW